jgi:hypothetical protein
MKRSRDTPDQVVRKLREADRLPEPSQRSALGTGDNRRFAVPGIDVAWVRLVRTPRSARLVLYVDVRAARPHKNLHNRIAFLDPLTRERQKLPTPTRQSGDLPSSQADRRSTLRIARP